MACVYLTLLLLTICVYILNAHEYHEESGKENEDRTSQLNKHKECMMKQNMKANKLYAFIRQYAKKKQDQGTVQEKIPWTRTDFKFRMKMNKRLRNLEKKGDMVSLNELTNKIKKAYEIQQDFKRLLEDASERGKEIPLGPNHEKHMNQMNKMKVYMKKLKRLGVPEQSAVNRASDKLMEYWFNHIENEGIYAGHHQTKEENLFRVRRELEIDDDNDTDPANPYHDPKNPFHFRRKLEDKLNKLALEENSAEIEKWKAKIIRANEAQKEFYEYVDNVTQDNNTIIVGYDHPGHRQHLMNMAIYKKALEKKHLEDYIIANKIADKNFAYWLKVVDNQTFANPHRKTTTPDPD